MADETRTDPDRGYSGSPEAYDFVRSTHSRQAELAKIKEMADARRQEVQRPPGSDTGPLESRIASLEKALAERAPRHDFSRHNTFALEVWANGVVTNIEAVTVY